MQELGPQHSIDLSGTPTAIRRAKWVVYRDDLNEIREGAGYEAAADSFTLINPVTITSYDQDGRTTDVRQAVRPTSAGPLVSTDEFPQSSWTRWSSVQFDDQGLISSNRSYFALPADGEGLAGANYNQTSFGYDVMDRQNRFSTPGGTITRTVYHPMGWVLQVWVGTDDTGATEADPSGGGAAGNNMVLVRTNVYDGGAAGGNGTLTQTTWQQDATTGRVTTFGYDFRNRRVFTDGEVDFYESYTLDNVGRVLQVDRYDTSPSGHLVARRENKFDLLGRGYQSIQYAVDSGGSVGLGLVANFWFDPVGNLIKSALPGSEATLKSVYDGVRRVTTQYSSYDVSETGYPYPISVASATVIEQAEYAYDAASNLISLTSRQRFHDATGTGPLTTPGGAQPKARVSYQASWPDALGRRQATADYGTNGAFAWSRPALAPDRSDTILVTSAAYNARGETYQSVDPMGTVNRFTFDAAGRSTEMLENFISGGLDPSENKRTQFTYNADSKLATLVAKNHVTGDQVTQFTYGTTLSNSAVASFELLRQKIYPDDSASAPRRDTYEYDRLAERTKFTDPNGTVHEYHYDALGRLLHDCAVTVGSGIDPAVRRLSRTYEVRGLLAGLSSYDTATIGSGSVVNDTLRTYNDFQQLGVEYQSHAGAVNPSTSPKVQYGYASGSANTIRPEGLIYPNGRGLLFSYGGLGSMPDSPEPARRNQGRQHPPGRLQLPGPADPRPERLWRACARDDAHQGSLRSRGRCRRPVRRAGPLRPPRRLPLDGGERFGLRAGQLWLRPRLQPPLAAQSRRGCRTGRVLREQRPV